MQILNNNKYIVTKTTNNALLSTPEKFKCYRLASDKVPSSFSL